MKQHLSTAPPPAPTTTAQSLGALLNSARGIMRKDKGLNGDLDQQYCDYVCANAGKGADAIQQLPQCSIDFTPLLIYVQRVFRFDENSTDISALRRRSRSKEFSTRMYAY